MSQRAVEFGLQSHKPGFVVDGVHRSAGTHGGIKNPQNSLSCFLYSVIPLLPVGKDAYSRQIDLDYNL